jgi:4'-phosphopantetheinyl transferase EntD
MPLELPSYDAEMLSKLLGLQLPPRVTGSVRSIAIGDENQLRATELCGLEKAELKVRRSSGTGRIIARALCNGMGFFADAIPRSNYGAPVWPVGVVGSIAHDHLFACAVVARARELGGLGIDIEPSAPLEDSILRLVATKQEQLLFRLGDHGTKVIFSLKEAVFKAVYAHDRIFLDFLDVNLDPRSRTAVTSYGRVVSWCFITQPHVIAVAWW